MPDRSRRRPRDLNALAASIVRDSTADDKTVKLTHYADRVATSSRGQGRERTFTSSNRV